MAEDAKKRWEYVSYTMANGVTEPLKSSYIRFDNDTGQMDILINKFVIPTSVTNIIPCYFTVPESFARVAYRYFSLTVLNDSGSSAVVSAEVMPSIQPGAGPYDYQLLVNMSGANLTGNISLYGSAIISYK